MRRLRDALRRRLSRAKRNGKPVLILYEEEDLDAAVDLATLDGDLPVEEEVEMEFSVEEVAVEEAKLKMDALNEDLEDRPPKISRLVRTYRRIV